MKKKILGSFAVLAIALVAAFNVNINTKENGLSAITLNNVEALASEGGTPAHYWCCGNTCTCAKGSGIIIHGHLRVTPC